MHTTAHCLPVAAPRFNTDHVKAGSPWGAGTFAGADGSRQPTDVELAYAKHQVRSTCVAGSCAMCTVCQQCPD